MIPLGKVGRVLYHCAGFSNRNIGAKGNRQIFTRKGKGPRPFLGGGLVAGTRTPQGAYFTEWHDRQVPFWLLNFVGAPTDQVPIFHRKKKFLPQS
ncbi:hypothetical protein CH373_08830 [Leptospira perolatii]|uniref:Uncharacterized protein n=1 Tax=Leptospira perolatii TaxID=2023191 RepID=A0A2M9ZNE0_9LEPT|nr:hypothetical protein CH360_09975 [Leptospira perolatii]PJZ73592.1 hypothetical protein CH373_08830 [Leptospira perolatii]